MKIVIICIPSCPSVVVKLTARLIEAVAVVPRITLVSMPKIVFTITCNLFTLVSFHVNSTLRQTTDENQLIGILYFSTPYLGRDGLADEASLPRYPDRIILRA